VRLSLDEAVIFYAVAVFDLKNINTRSKVTDINACIGVAWLLGQD
jgi:hypothetical protein